MEIQTWPVVQLGNTYNTTTAMFYKGVKYLSNRSEFLKEINPFY